MSETKKLKERLTDEAHREQSIKAKARYLANRQELLDKQKIYEKNKRLEKSGGVERKPGRPKKEVQEGDKKPIGRPRKYDIS